MKILIVEDDAFYAQYISEMLRDAGVETVQVRTAQDAVSVDPLLYEGAIVDVMLPNDPTSSGISNEESRGGFCTGIAVGRRLLEKNPQLKLVILSSDVVGREAEDWAGSKSVPFIRKSDSSERLRQALNNLGMLGAKQSPLAFIVHGRDETALLQLKNYIQNVLKWQEPIVLREQPSSGRTVIEKFEDYADKIDCVFVLLTPDDKGALADSNDERRRSRQNVIFELGFFYGALERRSGRIITFYKGPMELPSDISGVVWIDISDGVDSAGETIRKEIAPLLQY